MASFETGGELIPERTQDRVDKLISDGLHRIDRDEQLRQSVDADLFQGGEVRLPRLGDFDNEWGMIDPSVAASLGVTREEMLDQIRRKS